MCCASHLVTEAVCCSLHDLYFVETNDRIQREVCKHEVLLQTRQNCYRHLQDVKMCCHRGNNNQNSNILVVFQVQKHSDISLKCCAVRTCTTVHDWIIRSESGLDHTYDRKLEHVMNCPKTMPYLLTYIHLSNTYASTHSHKSGSDNIMTVNHHSGVKEFQTWQFSKI